MRLTVKHTADLAQADPAKTDTKYPQEHGVDRGAQTFRLLICCLAAANDLARDLLNWQRPIHGTLCALRQQLRLSLEYIETLLEQDT